MAGNNRPKKMASIVGAVSEALSMTNVPQQLLDMVLDTLLEVMKVDCCWVQRLSPNSRKLRLAAYRGFSPAMKRETGSIGLGQKFGNQVAGLGHKIVIPDLSRDREYDLSSFKEAGLRSLVAVPLRTYRVQGVVGIASRRKKRFNGETAELLTIIAGLIGMALDKADLYQRVLNSEKQLGTGTRLSLISSSGKGEAHQDLVAELKEAAVEWTMATGEAEKAAEQISKLTPPNQVDSPPPENGQDSVTELKEAAVEWPMTTDEVEKAAEQISELPAPNQVDSPQPESQPAVIPERVKADKIKVFIVDEQVILRHVLRTCLSQTTDIEVVGESETSVTDTMSVIEELSPHIVLVDANLPSFSGLGLARRIVGNSHGMSVILMAPYEDGPLVFESFRSGVAGYLGNDITGERLVSTIRRVFNGERVIEELFGKSIVAQWVVTVLRGMERKDISNPLIHDEMQMLDYFANGFSYKQVAGIWGVSEQEITARMTAIIDKLSTAGIPSGLQSKEKPVHG